MKKTPAMAHGFNLRGGIDTKRKTGTFKHGNVRTCGRSANVWWSSDKEYAALGRK